MGIPQQSETKRSSQAKPEPTRRSKPVAAPRTKVVWAVCDVGGRTVAKFDYPCKADAEALVQELKAKGKGMHFLRSLKEPISAD